MEAVNRTDPGSQTEGLADVDNELPKPASCRAAGLECRPCVQHAARNLAQICPNLSPDSVRDAFFKIYPDHACLPMARCFARGYRTSQPNDTDSFEGDSAEFEIVAVSTI